MAIPSAGIHVGPEPSTDRFVVVMVSVTRNWNCMWQVIPRNWQTVMCLLLERIIWTTKAVHGCTLLLN